MDKVQKTEKLIKRLKTIAKNAIKRRNYERALSALSACGNVLYEYNQRYKDDEIEELLLKIGNEIMQIPESFRPKDIKPVKTVLYYDGFGFDLRGLAANYTKIIASMGYKLIYVTNAKAEGNQPNIMRELAGYDVECIYINMDTSYISWIKKLSDVFLKYSPQVAYFYTTPYDVSGTIVFNSYKDKVIRLLVNLTDHAFWLGLNAFDFIGAGRAMGAWINFHEREIPLNKMYRYRSNIFISENIKLQDLPFDTQGKRYVFSGGALYKTLGDENHLFYKMIEHIITSYDDVNFLYAGEGDTSEFEKIISKYPDRVFLVHEREDFYQIIKGAVFYLNTYPMFGGQMMRYAAYAGKLPVTLKHNNDGEGILFNQGELGIEFNSYSEVIEEIDKLLTDEIYRKEKEKKLETAVVSIEETKKNYRMVIENQISPMAVLIEEFDTSSFKQKYIERLDYKNLEEICIAKKANYRLIRDFPFAFIRRLWFKLKVKHK